MKASYMLNQTCEMILFCRIIDTEGQKLHKLILLKKR